MQKSINKNNRYKIYDLLLSINVRSYFQPPKNIQIQYPCVVYSALPPFTQKADNINYINMKTYKLTYISQTYDEEIIDKILSLFTYCSITGQFVTDGMYHTMYEVTI